MGGIVTLKVRCCVSRVWGLHVSSCKVILLCHVFSGIGGDLSEI